MKLEDTFEQALASADSFAQLRSLAERLLAEGHSREDVLERFEAVRRQLREAGREAEEDALTDVMDCLVGWCGPHAKLGPGETANGTAPGSKQEGSLFSRGA